MKWVWILCLSLSMITFADENQIEGDCPPVRENFLQGILDFFSPPWHGASDKQIKASPCKTHGLPLQTDLEAFIKARSEGSAEGSVHGASFRDESPALLVAFKDFTTAPKIFSNGVLTTDQKNLQTEYNINPECDKVMCAMEKIWGKDLAYKMMYVKLKHNYNTSELAFPDSARFVEKEIDDVITGLEDLPQHLIPVGGKNQRLTHFTRAKTIYQGPAAANSAIMLFDLWSEESWPDRQYTIFHELSHNISTKLQDMDDSPEWLNLSGWIKKGDDWEAPSSACIISEYGKTNPAEDLAESLSAYRYNAARLKKKCPIKYDFIKTNVFKGTEYLDGTNCATIPPEKLQAAQLEMVNDIVNTIGNENITESEIMESCKDIFNVFPVDNRELASCSINAHVKIALARGSQPLEEILKRNGLPQTEAVQTLLLKNLNDEVLSAQMEEIAKKSANVLTVVNTIAQKSFEAANPDGFGQIGKEITASDYRWDIALGKCGQNIFETKATEVINCQLKYMIDEDLHWQRWGKGVFPAYKTPTIFSDSAKKSLTEKRIEVLAQHLQKLSVAQEVMIVQEKEFKKNMSYHHGAMYRKFVKLPNWEKMTPKDFCEKTYGAGSLATRNYGIPDGKLIPKLYNGCVREQSTSSSRFKFKEEDWMKMISEN